MDGDKLDRYSVAKRFDCTPQTSHRLLSLLKGVVGTSKPKARLRHLEYRGKVSAAMIRADSSRQTASTVRWTSGTRR